MAEKDLTVGSEDELGAAAADVHEQEGRSGELRVSGHAQKAPFRLLLARDDFDLQGGGLLDGGSEFLAIEGLAGCAGGDDADRDGLGLAGSGGEIGDGFGGSGNGFGLQAAGFVEAMPEAGLFALLA
jgi:hypothetical protein